MNKRQAKKLALITTASEILAGNEMACITDDISWENSRRFEIARQEMAYELLRRAGVENPMAADEAINFVLST